MAPRTPTVREGNDVDEGVEKDVMSIFGLGVGPGMEISKCCELSQRLWKRLTLGLGSAVWPDSRERG